ncbi:MAG: amidase [Vicinamibacterales bacterium]
MPDLHNLTIAEAAARLAARSLSSTDLTNACLDRIAQRDDELNAFITVMADIARAQAADADAAFARGESRGPLHGIPISLKDLIDFAGVPTTAASLVRRHHVATRHATVTERLLDRGAVIVGKTNLHEFAFGTTSEDSGFGAVRHPIDGTRSAGGSSGGSAAAIVAGMCLASIGTDTGGSIRIPAAVCGTVGLKAAFGEIATDGVVPLGATLDNVGPLARSVEDAAILYEALTDTPVVSTWTLDPPAPQRLRLGVPGGYFLDVLDDDVRASFEAAIARLRANGVHVDEVTIAHAADMQAIYLLIVLAEAADYHGPILERSAASYTAPVRMRLEMGRYVLAEDYLRAQRGRAVIRREIDAALDGRDALLLPTVPIPAPIQGATTVRVGQRDEPVRSAMLRLTQPFSLSTHPALTIPAAPTPAGLPVGLQLVGHLGRTPRLLGCGRACEIALGSSD